MATIETHTFRLRAGLSDADVEAFLRADARVQTEFAVFQPGFVRRTTARGGDGQWLVLLLWGDGVAADAARTAGDSDPAVTEFRSFVDDASYRVERFETLE